MWRPTPLDVLRKADRPATGRVPYFVHISYMRLRKPPLERIGVAALKKRHVDSDYFCILSLLISEAA